MKSKEIFEEYDMPPPDIHNPAYVQQMDQSELDDLQSDDLPLYTTDSEPESEEPAQVGNITDYIDSQYIDTFDSLAGYFKHVETPAGVITYINGGIDGYMMDMFMDEYYNPIDTKLLVLNSPGGMVQDILDISEQIRMKSIPVAVPSGARCMSACNAMFAAGVGRYVAADAEFMIHHVRFGGDQADGTRLALKQSIDFFGLISNLMGEPQYYPNYKKLINQKLNGEPMTWQNDDLRVDGSWIIQQGYARSL